MQSEGIKILITGTEKTETLLFEEVFKKSQYTLITASSADETIEKSKQYLPHIFILDISLPDKDGIELCAELRSKENFQKSIIVFYTRRNEDYSQIAAFNAGADDYILKPAKPNILKSRIGALLKRFNYSIPAEKKITKGVFIDREQYLVFKDGEEIVLPRKEFELLALLSTSPRKVFTREEISKVVWGYDTQAHNRTIDVHVRKLRQKLGKHYIKTVKGVGYSIVL